jgi:predicted outer membrane repeat protein
MLKQIWKRIGQVFIMIKRILTLRVVFDNILGSQKYKTKNEILNSTTTFGGGIYSRTVKVYSFI